MSLSLYIKEVNVQRELWNGFRKNSEPEKLLPYPKTIEEVKQVMNQLEGDLSPENLTQDGEASAAYVRTRSCMLNDALAELEQLRYKLATKSVDSIKTNTAMFGDVIIGHASQTEKDPPKVSKKVRAQAIFDDMMKHSATRAEVIARFQEVLCMSYAGASTYYYNCVR